MNEVSKGRGYWRNANLRRGDNMTELRKCPFCDGTGEYEPFDLDVELDKLYPTEQTNEEWFCQLSTDEKAYFLSVEAVRAISEYENNGTERTCSSFWEYWLKAVHKE